MKQTDCGICGKREISLNETIKIDQQVYCSSCFETHFDDQKKLETKLVEKQYDTTICSSCNQDFGDIELNKISVYPICTACETSIKNKTFPPWVKGFLAAILVIVIGSCIWNWKFYKAYKDIKSANAYFQKNDYVNATLFMNSARTAIPEVEDLKTMATFFKGVELLSKDKGAAALDEFNACKDKMPEDFNVNKLIIQSKISSTFNSKDYEGFLAASKENLFIDSTQAVSLTSVASAYACIYAEKGDEKAKENAVAYLNRAKNLDSTSKDMKEYYNVVEYRIHSRKIISREEFIKQFPNGWVKN